MEHICNECDEVWFDNKSFPKCPHCKSSDAVSIFDETPDKEENEDEKIQTRFTQDDKGD